MSAEKPLKQRIAETAAALADNDRDAAAARDLATFRQFRDAKDPKSGSFNPMAAAALANRDYEAIKRGKDLEATLSADLAKAEQTATVETSVQAAVALLAARPSSNSNNPPPAPAPAA